MSYRYFQLRSSTTKVGLGLAARGALPPKHSIPNLQLCTCAVLVDPVKCRCLAMKGTCRLGEICNLERLGTGLHPRYSRRNHSTPDTAGVITVLGFRAVRVTRSRSSLRPVSAKGCHVPKYVPDHVPESIPERAPSRDGRRKVGLGSSTGPSTRNPKPETRQNRKRTGKSGSGLMRAPAGSSRCDKPGRFASTLNPNPLTLT